MRCEAFENRLNEVLDERRNPRDDDALAAHARKCRRCASSLSAHDLLLEVLQGTASHRSLDVADLSEVVLRKFDEQDRTEGTAPTARRAKFRWTWLTLAACLFLAFAPLAWRQIQPGSIQGTAVAKQIVPPVHPAPPSVIVYGPEVSDPVADVARNIGQSMARTGVVTVPGVGLAPASTIALTDTVPLPDDVANGLESLRPLTVPVSAAVTVLRKTIPRVADRPDSRSSWNVSASEFGGMV